MHRNERIARAIDTLAAIEAAVDAKYGKGNPDQNAARVENTVQLYCSAEQAEATYSNNPV